MSRVFEPGNSTGSFDSYVSELVYAFVSCAQPSMFVRKYLADNATIKQTIFHMLFFLIETLWDALESWFNNFIISLYQILSLFN